MIVKILPWLKETAEGKLSTGDVGQGLWYYDRILQIGRDDRGAFADAHARIGEILLAMGETQQAKVHLLEALKLKPTCPHYLFLLSCLYASTANWKKAREFARKAHILAPNNSNYVRALGWAVLCSGDLRSGEKMLRQAVSLDPQNVGAVGDLSAALIEQRRFSEAVEILTRAVKEHPEEKRLAEMLAVAMRFRGQSRERKTLFPARFAKQHGIVEELLRQQMPDEGFHSEQVDSAIQLWRDYARNVELSMSSPRSWAAAVEYTISKLDRDLRVTQKSLAEKYGVSVSSISMKFRQLWEGLDAKEFDPRYSTHKNLAGKLFQERDPADSE